MYFHKNYLS